MKQPARFATLTVVAVLTTTPAGAQFAPARREPRWFASIGTGFQLGAYVVDAASGSQWDLDAGFPLRVTVERVAAPNITIGAMFSYARLPMTYSSQTTSGCSPSCGGDATVSNYGALLRYGDGQGFRRLVEITLGAMRYGNFVQKSNGATLAPRSNTDFAFGTGFGFGYGFANDWQVSIMQDAVTSIHERPDESIGGSRVARHYVTRVGVRVGF